MAEIKRSTLFGKLNSLGYKSIEGATVFCKLRGNPYVETVHWLHQLLQLPDSDVHRVIKHFGLDPSRLAADLIAALDKLPRGATSISDISADIASLCSICRNSSFVTWLDTPSEHTSTQSPGFRSPW